MTSVNLVGEIYNAALKVRESHQDWLAKHDVGPVAIYGTPPRLHGDFGVARAQFHGDFFEFAPDGAPVLVLGVAEHPAEEIIDLVAFEPSNPGRWYLRLGQAVVLGRHNARLALFEESPVFIHATPLDWLRANCQGAVVLDWKADLLSYLDGYGVLAADDVTQRRLHQKFKRHIHIPEVRVVERRNAA